LRAGTTSRRFSTFDGKGQLCPAENKSPFKHCGGPPEDHELGRACLSANSNQ
jgi:hypothetical protein